MSIRQLRRNIVDTKMRTIANRFVISVVTIIVMATMMFCCAALDVHAVDEEGESSDG